MYTRITLVRHGQTAWNRERRWQGHAVVPLNDLGRQQAQAVGSYLTSMHVDRIYSSDLLRARQTAYFIRQYLKCQLKFDRRLREIDLGEWQGMTLEEIQMWDAERLGAVMQDSYANPRPGGESYQQLGDRGCAALHDYVILHPGEHIIVVTHGGTIRQIVFRLLHLELPQAVENTSLTTLQFNINARTWAGEALIITPHLGDDAKEGPVA